MKQISDVIVIGSGIVGAATVFALTRTAQPRVTLIEKGPLASGMTRRNAGLVHPFQPYAALAELALASFAFYNQLAMHLSSKRGFVKTGAAILARDNADTAKIFAHAQMLAPLTQEVTSARSAFAAQYPDVVNAATAGLFTPNAGYADAFQTAQQMIKISQARGMNLATGTFAKQLRVHSGRVQGVTTTTGEFEAPNVIVAAGGWSEKLVAPYGLALGLQFWRGAVLFYEQPATVTEEHPIFLDANGAFFLRPHPYRMSAAGYVSSQTESLNADQLDEYVPPTISARVTQFAAQYLPALAHTQPKRGHTIAYDTLADGLPALGRVANVEGLYVAAGFGASAFAVAPAVGDTLAQMVVDGTTSRDISAFYPLRTMMTRQHT